MTVPNDEPRLDFVTCASPAGLHRIAYWEWGDPDNDNVLLCVHGLTRTGRDFDLLAQALSNNYRVVCPDVVGRGLSDWLAVPMQYGVPQYVADMITLIARLNPRRLDWVGTSMGGLIGMGLASALETSLALKTDRGPYSLKPSQRVPLGRMVLNDVGPALNFEGLDRIARYVGEPVILPSFDAAVDYVSTMSAGFGPHDRAGWEDLTRHVFVPQGDQWVKHYDLKIAVPFAELTREQADKSEAILWRFYQSIRVPMLIIRGEESDLLSAENAQAMLERNPMARLVNVPGVGHAPSLRSAEQIEQVRSFLLDQSSVQ